MAPRETSASIHSLCKHSQPALCQTSNSCPPLIAASNRQDREEGSAHSSNCIQQCKAGNCWLARVPHASSLPPGGCWRCTLVSTFIFFPQTVKSWSQLTWTPNYIALTFLYKRPASLERKGKAFLLSQGQAVNEQVHLNSLSTNSGRSAER